MAQPLTILLLVKNSIQALDSGDYGKGQKYLNLAEQELGRNMIDVSSSLNPQAIISTSNATYNNSVIMIITVSSQHTLILNMA